MDNNSFFFIILVVSFILGIFGCLLSVRQGQESTTTGQSSGATGDAAGASSSDNNMEELKRAASLRAKVVQGIFPEQKVDSNNFQYDPEANSFRWVKENKNIDTTCSICIEQFREGDDVVSSQCNHTFHRDCLLGWGQIREDCPVCRQNMWDPEAYTTLEEKILEDGSPHSAHSTHSTHSVHSEHSA